MRWCETGEEVRREGRRQRPAKRRRCSPSSDFPFEKGGLRGICRPKKTRPSPQSTTENPSHLAGHVADCMRPPFRRREACVANSRLIPPFSTRRSALFSIHPATKVLLRLRIRLRWLRLRPLLRDPHLPEDKRVSDCNFLQVVVST